MPYTIQKNDEGEHCVHIKNADDSIGKKIACHETRDGAIAQIAAIESDEKKSKKSFENGLHVYVNLDNVNPNTGTYTVSSGDSVVDDAIWDSMQGNNDMKSVAKTDEQVVVNEPTDKGMSLDELRFKIVDAWDSEYSLPGMWVSEVYYDDGFVVVMDDRKIYKVDFSINDDEKIEFSPKLEWVEVNLKKEWVEKSVSLSDRLNFEKFIIDGNEEDNSEPELDARYAVKSLGEKRLGGYGILWGDPDSKDLYGEWFDTETRDIKTIFNAMGKIPLIVHHAADEEVKTFVYGEVDVMEEDETGLWWEAKIKEFEVYRKYVEPLLKRRAMFSSTGTLPAAKRRTKSGRITRWPVAEMTTTWIPAEWRMLERPVDEIKAAYKAINLNCDLSEYDDARGEEKPDGAEKARLKAIVDLHLSELDLLDLE